MSGGWTMNMGTHQEQKYGYDKKLKKNQKLTSKHCEPYYMSSRFSNLCHAGIKGLYYITVYQRAVHPAQRVIYCPAASFDPLTQSGILHYVALIVNNLYQLLNIY